MAYVLTCVAGALAGFFAGYRFRERRGTRPAESAESAEESTITEVAATTEDTEAVDAETVDAQAVDIAAVDSGPPQTPTAPAVAPVAAAGADTLRTAREVLDVADHVTNPELSRRLAEAVVRLPGVTAIRPRPGDAFAPGDHEWVAGRATEDRGRWDTVAEIRAPGASASGRLLRPAHVIVFEPPEEP